MNCDTYLSMLETLPFEELSYGSARDHAAVCRDCDRVTRVVFERERNMVMAFGELYPPGPAEALVDRALVISRRRKIAFYFRGALGVATAAAVLFVFISRLVPTRTPFPGPVINETFRLQCLSPEQAVEVIRPYRSPRVDVSIRPSSPVGIIQVVAPPGEMQRIQSVLDRFDTPAESRCAVQVTVPKNVPVP